MRDLTELFAEEAGKLEQSQLFTLIALEVTVLCSSTGTDGSDELVVSDSSELEAGQYIHIEGIDELRSVIEVVDATNIKIEPALDEDVTDANTTLCLALVGANHSVTYNGITYTQFPMQFSAISASSDGTIDQASLSIANVSKEIMYYVELYDGLRDRLVMTKSVFEAFVDFKYEVDPDGTVRYEINENADVDAFTEDRFKVDAYVATEETIQLSLYPAVDVEIMLPTRKYTSDSCYFHYRDANSCQLDLDALMLRPEIIEDEIPREYFETCPKTVSGCRERFNSLRFGGFPGISGQRRVFL